MKGGIYPSVLISAVEVKDLEAVIDYVKTLPYADANNILLMGCGQHGFSKKHDVMAIDMLKCFVKQ